MSLSFFAPVYFEGPSAQFVDDCFNSWRNPGSRILLEIYYKLLAPLGSSKSRRIRDAQCKRAGDRGVPQGEEFNIGRKSTACNLNTDHRTVVTTKVEL